MQNSRDVSRIAVTFDHVASRAIVYLMNLAIVNKSSTEHLRRLLVKLEISVSMLCSFNSLHLLICDVSLMNYPNSDELRYNSFKPFYSGSRHFAIPINKKKSYFIYLPGHHRINAIDNVRDCNSYSWNPGVRI